MTTDLAKLLEDHDPADAGRRMHDLCRELFPLTRSITGDGVRQTLEVVSRTLPLERHEVPSGTPALDWTVPQEWNLRDAWITGPGGRRVVDLADSNLHVMSYSVPVRARMPLAELEPHLHSLPDRPTWIPYRTSYYNPDWGFCLRHDVREALPEGEYEVVIDASLEDGSLTYGECLVPGELADEVLLTTHICHPSMANDNLSGIALLTTLGEALTAMPLRHSYRLLFIPGTIGSITWLDRNPEAVARVKHGIVLSGVGDPGPFTWKRSRRGDAEIDRVMAHVLAAAGTDHQVIDYYPYGYDERQFCSPGFNLPVGRFGRTPHHEYPEYHTSGDDLDFVSPERLGQSLAMVLGAVDVLERNGRYENLAPRGEPQLGRRGLYRPVGGDVDKASVELALLWVLSGSATGAELASDAGAGSTLLDIAEQSGLSFDVVARAAQRLRDAGLLRPGGSPT